MLFCVEGSFVEVRPGFDVTVDCLDDEIVVMIDRVPIQKEHSREYDAEFEAALAAEDEGGDEDAPIVNEDGGSAKKRVANVLVAMLRKHAAPMSEKEVLRNLKTVFTGRSHLSDVELRDAARNVEGVQKNLGMYSIPFGA